MANNHKTLASLFSDTADAIRAKQGSSGSKVADNFPAEIRKIVTVSEGTSDATAAAADIVKDKTAYVKGKKVVGTFVPAPATADAVLESVTVTPTGETFTVTPDEGVDGFDSVKVKGDYNLTPENIAEGITIYGVEGTLKIGATEEVPSQYDPYVEHAKLMYTGDYANLAILESNNKLNVAFLMDDFTVLSYDEASTEFTAKGWLYCEYTKDSQTWRIVDYRTEASTGTNYVKHIRYSSVYWTYNGKTIWPMGASEGGDNALYTGGYAIRGGHSCIAITCVYNNETFAGVYTSSGSMVT